MSIGDIRWYFTYDGPTPLERNYGRLVGPCTVMKELQCTTIVLDEHGDIEYVESSNLLTWDQATNRCRDRVRSIELDNIALYDQDLKRIGSTLHG